MTGLLKCLAYLALSGFLGFLLGRALPRRWFRYRVFPYRDHPLEQRGNLYRRLYIHKWHNHVPDMSRIFRGWMPPKRLEAGVDSAAVEVMVQETCVAEFTHVALCVTGLAVLWIWPGPGGAALYVLYVLGNLPFILIQRFNRPKLVQLMEKLRRRGA